MKQSQTVKAGQEVSADRAGCAGSDGAADARVQPRRGALRERLVLRPMIVGLLVSTIAAAVSVVVIRPIYRVRGVVTVHVGGEKAGQVLGRIAAELLSDPVLKEAAKRTDVSGDYLAGLVNAGGLRAFVAKRQGQVALELVHWRKGRGARWLDEIFTSYRDQVRRAAKMDAELVARRSGVAATLASERQQLGRLLAELTGSGAGAGANELLDELGEFGRRWRDLGRDRSAVEVELLDLRRASLPTGRVEPEELARAQAADRVLSEDVAQLATAGRQLLGELLLALEAVDGRLDKLLLVVGNTSRTIEHEAAMRTGSELGGGIGRLSPEVQAYGHAANELRQGLKSLRRQLERAEQGGDGRALLELQRQVERAVNDFGDRAEPLVRGLRGAVERMGQGGGSLTKRAVAQAVLGRSVRSLAAAHTETLLKADGLTAAGNFRVESYRHVMTGLARRSGQRRASIRARLQERADGLAGQRRRERVDQLAGRLEQLERQMAGCVGQIIDQQGRLRGLLTAVVATPTAELAETARAAVVALRRELADIDSRLDAAGIRTHVPPEALSYAGARVVSGAVNRSARLATGVMVFLACMLTVMVIGWARGGRA